jgi:uncharacterized protein YcbK (DUF882 family)
MASGLRFMLGSTALVALAMTPGLAAGDAPKPNGKTAVRAPPAAPKRANAGVAASFGWHTPTPGKAAPVDGAGRPMLVMAALNTGERITLTANTEHGGFSALELDRAAHLLRDPRTGNEHPVDPHVLDLVYRVAVHFSSQEVRVISGYRTPKNGSHSNHGKGRAIDLVFPGTSDEEVARYARELGFVGVGVYPVSGFVHLDVRDRSYFWVDNSGPGKKNRTRGILADLAAKSDARALGRGEHAPPPFTIASDVDAALASESHGQAAAQAGEDDDVDEGAP